MFSNELWYLVRVININSIMKSIFLLFSILFVQSVNGQPSRYYLATSLEVGNFGPKQYELETKDIQVAIRRYPTVQSALQIMRRRNEKFSYGIGVSYVSWRIKQKIDWALPVYDFDGSYTWRYTPTWLFQWRLGIDFRVNYEFNKFSLSLDHGIYKVCGQNPIDVPYDYQYHRTQIILPDIIDFENIVSTEKYYSADKSLTQSITCFSLGYKLNENFGVIASARFNWFTQSESQTSYHLYVHQTSEHNGQYLENKLVKLTVREPSWSFGFGIRYSLPAFKKKYHLPG
jgi:hypothetical protein